jgi:hypothetical protein
MYYISCEFFMMVIVQILVFGVVMLYSLVGG